MKMVKDESTRELLAFNAGSAKTNITGPLLDQLIQKRHEEALALGYSSFSEMSLQKRMAKNPLIVQNFEEGLVNLMLNKSRQELQVLTELKRNDTGNSSAIFQSWDYSYYNDMLIKKNYQLDLEQLKEYFPMEQVAKETMDIY